MVYHLKNIYIERFLLKASHRSSGVSNSNRERAKLKKKIGTSGGPDWFTEIIAHIEYGPITAYTMLLYGVF